VRTSVVSATWLGKNHSGIGLCRLGGAIIVPPSTLEPAQYVVELSYSKENHTSAAGAETNFRACGPDVISRVSYERRG